MIKREEVGISGKDIESEVKRTLRKRMERDKHRGGQDIGSPPSDYRYLLSEETQKRLAEREGRE